MVYDRFMNLWHLILQCKPFSTWSAVLLKLCVYLVWSSISSFLGADGASLGTAAQHSVSALLACTSMFQD
jgi:hypothetical protein